MASDFSSLIRAALPSRFDVLHVCKHKDYALSLAYVAKQDVSWHSLFEGPLEGIGPLKGNTEIISSSASTLSWHSIPGRVPPVVSHEQLPVVRFDRH